MMWTIISLTLSTASIVLSCLALKNIKKIER